MRIHYKLALIIFFISLVVTSIVFLVSDQGNRSLMLIVYVPVFSALFAYPAVHYIFRPFARLYKGVEMVQYGNLDYPITAGTKDEIGRLGGAIDNVRMQLHQQNSSMDSLQVQLAEHQQREKQVKTKLSQLERVIENMTVAMFIYYMDGTIVDVNETACRLLGYHRDELMHLSFYQLQPDAELKKSRTAMKTGSGSTAVRFESYVTHKTGRLISVEISTHVIDTEMGICQSLMHDITPYKRLQEATRRSEERFRSFMETASDLMFMADMEGRFTYVNQAMEETLAYPRAVMLGMGISDLMDVMDVNITSLYQEWLDLNKSGEVTWHTRRKEILYGEIKTKGILDEKGTLIGIRGVVRNVTERKKMAESQRLTQLGKLAADVAHEVKNQLTCIYSLAEMALIEGADEDQVRSDLQAMLAQCQELNDIVRRLLSFSRPSQGEYNEANIHEIIDLVLKLVEKSYEADDITIVRSYDMALPKTRVDVRQMREVFMNLVQNAREAMDSGGKIEIVTSLEDHHLRIDVRDTGAGISEADMKKIFDPFFTTKSNGTGLGVSACYGIVKAHDGNLEYSSTPGEGTIASVFLPVEDANPKVTD